MEFIGYSDNKLDKLGAKITACEICNQPQIWRDTFQKIKDNKSIIKKFLDRALEHKDTRIILTGAGSSAFVGESVALYLNSVLDYKVETIESTDIVSHPEYYLKKDVPTLLISCARSGNSPESVATAKLAEQIIDNLYHLALTCNEEGELAKFCNSKNDLVLLMPEESNDKGFAMTGSFTAMVLASLLIFNLEKLDIFKEHINRVADLGDRILNDSVDILKELSMQDVDRIVYLGSGGMKGLARESALKVLELTSGQIATTYDSCLGFRHGPKSIVNDKTLLIIYLSNDSYARKYEMDFLEEISNQKGDHKILSITGYEDDVVRNNSDYYISIDSDKKEYEDDIFLLFDYILNAQMLAVYQSIKLGVKADDPSPSGNVNRVVKGVIIHEYK
ncbi:SIS domain-containing protein [Clostridiaceae bacterium M8S5]|nr:SIS domain-containing protein [Clostridiaceae bacterium M8S5]